MAVSAGTTRGLGSMAFFTAVWADSAMDGDALASVPAGWSADFWQPATSRQPQNATAKTQAKRRFINFLPGLRFYSFKHTLDRNEAHFSSTISRDGTVYVAKPFVFAELAARIRAVLRRGDRPGRSVLQVEDLELDRVSPAVGRGTQNIELSPKEFALLE